MCKQPPVMTETFWIKNNSTDKTPTRTLASLHEKGTVSRQIWSNCRPANPWNTFRVIDFAFQYNPQSFSIIIINEQALIKWHSQKWCKKRKIETEEEKSRTQKMKQIATTGWFCSSSWFANNKIDYVTGYFQICCHQLATFYTTTIHKKSPPHLPSLSLWFCWAQRLDKRGEVWYEQFWH